MATLVVLVGISGGGKSTYVEKKLKTEYPDIITISSDAIRGEIYGDESEQKNPKVVFAIAHQRIEEALRNNRDVVLDATNLSRKNRMALLNRLKNNPSIPDFESVAHIILCTPEICIERQNLRERKVPEEVIMKQMKQFQLPIPSEGWTQPNVYYNPAFSKTYLEELLELCKNFDQHSNWHQEPLDMHQRMVKKYAELSDFSTEVILAASLHDIGKLYTRTYDDKGNTHFFGHPNVSAWLYLCGTVISRTLSEQEEYIEQLIERHDDVLNRDITTEKYRTGLQDKLIQDLLDFAVADSAGSLTLAINKDVSVLDFINTYKDFEKRLQNEPFCIKIKQNDDYMLLKYNQIDSDMTYRITQEARGPIFKQEDGKFVYVCRPFDKFFNHGQAEEHQIDWNTARVTEKIDGSLMKVFYDDGCWHLATNGSIDAFQTKGDNSPLSFAEIFERALGYSVTELGTYLDPAYTYMFELTSPETRLVIEYGDNVYYLAKRHTETGVEDYNPPMLPNVKYPSVYHLTNIDDVVTAASKMTKDEEGFVINDAEGNRIKVKSPEYLYAFHAFNNNVLTYSSILELIKDEQVDDIVALFPQFIPRIEEVKEKLEETAQALEDAWDNAKQYRDKDVKEFALSVKGNMDSDYLFQKYRHPDLTPMEYLFNKNNNFLLKRLGYKQTKQMVR